MQKPSPNNQKHPFRLNFFGKTLVGVVLVVIVGVGYFFFSRTGDAQTAPVTVFSATVAQTAPAPQVPALDIVAYDAKMLQLANNPVPKASASSASTAGTATSASTAATAKPPKPTLWPVHAVYPNAGALLPFNRIVAFYGNFYSKGMGILGQYPPDVVLAKLTADVQAWQAADPTTPVIPAIHYIATTAQKYPGADGKHILRMPFSQIDKAIALANQAHAIVFLDVQLGQSNVQTELPLLAKYLAMPQVHLGLDPEFAMKPGQVPGTVVGTMDAKDINWAAQYLAKIVRDNNLPPKILIVHRFTQDMVTNAKLITPLPEVQIVMNMDGWGTPDHKITTYRNIIYPQPVQFTGFKLFYHNDLQKPSMRLMTPAEILKLRPQPSYIQYQ